MIGGYDTFYVTDSPNELAVEMMSFVDWPESFIEQDEEDEGDFFWYKDQASKNLWDAEGCIEAAENTMIYFLIDDHQLTVVSDKELTETIRNKFTNYETLNE